MNTYSWLYRFNRILVIVSLLLFNSHSVVLPASPPKLTVLAFLNTECPISQQYTRSLTMLYQHFKPLGVRFVAVFPLRTDSLAVIQRFRNEFNLPFSGQPDTGAQLTRRYSVRVTPEVVITQANGQVRYQGAIDDWYVDLGKHRSKPTHNYLLEALNALLLNQLVMQPRTEAVGCLIE